MVNITELSSMNGNPVTLLQIANSWTGDLYGLFFLVIIIMSTYYGLRGGFRAEPSRESLSAAFFVGAVVSVLLVMLGVLSNRMLAATIILAGGALAMLINRR